MGSSAGRVVPRRSAGRVVPGEERAGHVSRPRPSFRGLSPDLDTPPRSSSATRSADGEFRWSSSALRFRWSSSARRGTSRARVETSTKSPETVTGSRHASSFLVGYSISGSVGFRWSSSAPRGTSRARVETSTKSPGTRTGSRHGRSSLAAYSISGWGVRRSSSALWFRWSSSAPRGTSRARVETLPGGGELPLRRSRRAECLVRRVFLRS